MVRPQGVRKGGGRKGEIAEGNRTLVTSVISSWKQNIKKKNHQQSHTRARCIQVWTLCVTNLHQCWLWKIPWKCWFICVQQWKVWASVHSHISAWVLKHPDADPISCFILHSSSLLEVIVKWYLLWIMHGFSLQQRLYLAAVHPLGLSSAGPPLQEQQRALKQRKCKVCS